MSAAVLLILTVSHLAAALAGGWLAAGYVRAGQRQLEAEAELLDLRRRFGPRPPTVTGRVVMPLPSVAGMTVAQAQVSLALRRARHAERSLAFQALMWKAKHRAPAYGSR